MLHDLHADIARIFFGKRDIAVIEHAPSAGGNTGEREFESDEPPEIRSQRALMRLNNLDRIDDDFSHSQH